MSERVKPSPLVLHDTMGLMDIVAELDWLLSTLVVSAGVDGIPQAQ